MNFIKKKLKGHKKDDEEEEYEKAVYEQSLHPQKQEPMKNTEEWQFFQQLSMKVQDTVQKTQTTLNKLKDTRPEDALNDDDNFYDLESELHHKETPPYGTSKVLRAPPRPPPPAGDKSSNPIDFGSDFSQSTIPKGPPRPPPPGASDSSFVMDSSALYGTQSKGFASPARPPPPSVKKIDSTNVSEFLPLSGSLSSNENSTGKGAQTASFSLLEEFGFKSEPITTTNTNFQDLLFLDDKEEVDPFDTSFVDVKNIASSLTLTAERKGSIAKEKVPEKSFNPFCSNSGTSNEWSSSIHSDKNKKSMTNPFFTATDENKTESSIDSQSIPTFNPFSFNTAKSSSNNHDDLFGITVGTSSSKDDLNENLFSKTDELLTNTADYDYEKNFVNPAFNGSEPSHVGNIMDDLMNTDQDSVTDITYPQNIMGSTCKWESDKSEDLNTFASESSEISVLPDKPLQPSSIWGASGDILKPEKISTDEPIKPAEEERRMSEVSEFNLLRKNSNQANDFDEEIDGSVKALDIAKDENMFTEKPNQTSAEINQEENWSPEEKLEIHPTLLKEDASDKIIPASDSFEMAVPRENVDSIEIEQQPMYADDFSKPFDEENKNDAFLFKVKSTDKKSNIEFDAFAAKFESAKDIQGTESFDPFLSKRAPALKKLQENYKGFESMDEFDPFKITIRNEDFPNTLTKELSRDSFEDYDNEVDFSVVIKPKVKDSCDVKLSTMEPPKLLPPPKTPTKAFELPASRFNPFDKDFLDSSEISKATEKVIETVEADDEPVPALGEAGVRKADSIESPLSPLFDEDTSLPLEIFPKPYDKEGWEMVLRQPNKKKLTGNRFWKKIFVKLSENSVLQLFNKFDDKLPFQELPLQACYSLSEIGAQQYDQYGKIFTVKLQYKFYRERVGVRPGQISKVTQGQVTTMGDVAKLGLPLQHSAQTSQLIKIGSQFYSDIKYFIQEVEDALFRMTIHRDRVLTYKTEEVQVIAQDEFYVEQSKTGHIDKQLARVRIFFLAFITGMPSVEVGLNDIIRQGKEVVGRYDIIPVVTEEWIRLEDCEFHSCVIQDEFYKSRVIKFHPPDACLFELLRFRIRPPKNRELPLQVRVFMTVSNTRVEIRSDILVPGYSSRKQGQVPCENIQIRFPMPECWIYLFRTEKHFRYGSKKSTARRPGKIKGLERIIGAAQNLDPSLIEVSAGQAKYEHVFHAVVWRIPRLPKEGQGAYTQQLFLLRTELTSFDQIPETFEQFVDVEFTMPATYVSHTTVRSVSVTNPIPPEKYVRYVSKHEYKVEIDFKKSSDEIDGLMAASNVSVPVSSTPPVQESIEDEDKDDSD